MEGHYGEAREGVSPRCSRVWLLAVTTLWLVHAHHTRLAHAHHTRLAHAHHTRLAHAHHTRLAQAHNTRLAHAHNTHLAHSSTQEFTETLIIGPASVAISPAEDLTTADVTEAFSPFFVTESINTAVVTEATNTAVVTEALQTAVVAEVLNPYGVTETLNTAVVTEATSVVTEALQTAVVTEVLNPYGVTETLDTAVVTEALNTAVVLEDTSVVTEALKTSVVPSVRTPLHVTANVRSAAHTLPVRPPSTATESQRISHNVQDQKARDSASVKPDPSGPALSLQQTTNRSEKVLDNDPLSELAEDYTMTLQDCIDNRTIHGSQGTVLGFHDPSGSGVVGVRPGLRSCRWRIVVPVGRFVVSTVDILGLHGPCGSDLVLQIQTSHDSYPFNLSCAHNARKSPFLYFPSNVAEILVFNETISPDAAHIALPLRRVSLFTDLPSFRVAFTSAMVYLGNTMTITTTAQLSGFVTSPGFDASRPHDPNLNASYSLIIPESHAVMVSFPYLKIRLGFVRLSLLTSKGTTLIRSIKSIFRKFGPDPNLKLSTYRRFGPYIYHDGVSMKIKCSSSAGQAGRLDHSRGVNMSFSFHPEATSPVRTGDSDSNSNFQWECSQPAVYASFKEHVHCNGHNDCLNRKDEENCPWDGYYIGSQTATCDSLAMMKTPRQLEALWHFLENRNHGYGCYKVGLYREGGHLNPLYRHTWRWADNASAFDVNIVNDDYESTTFDRIVIAEDNQLKSVDPATTSCSSSICQRGSQLHTNGDVIPTLLLQSVPIAHPALGVRGKQLVPCSRGHLTHTFLRCFFGCGSQEGQRCPLSSEESQGLFGLTSHLGEAVAMFRCERSSSFAVVPYTLTCDFINDCQDSSDETFCRHPCPGTGSFQCANGQCIQFRQRCDGFTHCFDASDELACARMPSTLPPYNFAYYPKLPPPSILYFSSDGVYSQTALTSFQACPETHFRCSNSSSVPRGADVSSLPPASHCMPVFLRCNGVRDCPNSEDEAGCDQFTCPGYYRCRDSRACVHVAQVCDGVAHCPRRDDEWLCQQTCPRGCACQGNTFLCLRPFPAHTFPDLRYLDATGSGMVLANLTSNTYLVWLRLAFCGIDMVEQFSLSNLRTLDLSHNQLKTVSVDVPVALPNLKEMLLSANPLVSLLLSNELGMQQAQLQRIDLSQSVLDVFNCNALMNFPRLQKLNLSHNRAMLTIGDSGFKCNPDIRELDLRGTYIQQSPFTLFQGLENIELVYSDEYRHCCRHTLPQTSEAALCFAPSSGFSSCEDLLRLDMHRASVWTTAILSPVANVACLLARFLTQTEARGSSTHILLNHLAVANVLTGAYQFVIAVADTRFRGNFILHERSWLSSDACQGAGALLMVSSQASSFLVFLLALDRFVALRGAVTGPGLGRRSTWLACLVSWLAAVTLAGAPFVSGAAVSGLYSRTGLCLALPSLGAGVPGYHGYAFAVLAVLNPLLASVAAYWQIIVHLDFQASYVIASQNPRSRDLLLALRLRAVVVADILCWWSVGALGLLTSLGVLFPDADVIVAVLLLPWRPSLQPWLYWLSVQAERRRLKRESWALTLHAAKTKAQRATDRPAVTTGQVHARERVPAEPPTCKDDVIGLLKRSLQSRHVSSRDVQDMLRQHQ